MVCAVDVQQQRCKADKENESFRGKERVASKECSEARAESLETRGIKTAWGRSGCRSLSSTFGGVSSSIMYRSMYLHEGTLARM